MTKISKDDYILRMLSKIRHKKWENYAVNRIVHRLDDLEVEFTCQQYVRTDGSYALTDLYFPQFKLVLEVDELHHKGQKKIAEDSARDKDIKKAIDGADVRRIGVDDPETSNGVKSIQKLNAEIDEIVKFIKIEKQKMGKNFKPWDFDRQYDPQTYIALGKLDASERVAFLNHRDALKCFGYSKGHLQSASWKIPGTEKLVWFPKFYDNDKWENRLVSDPPNPPEIVEKTILEDQKSKNRHLTPEGAKNRIVFAHESDPLGQVLYRFLGEFEIVREKCDEKTCVFRRVSQVVDLSPYHSAA